MRCIVLSDDDQCKDLFTAYDDVVYVKDADMIPAGDNVLFDLRDEAWDMERYAGFSQPVFIAAVTGTLAEHHAPDHIVRINAWPGMLSKPVIEAAASENIRTRAENILNQLGKNVEWVSDIPGMISARVISMIINESCMALDEGVSDETSIDIAMKLGTNYPMGPFEWGEVIGMEKIARLLKKLSEIDPRYLPGGKLREIQ